MMSIRVSKRAAHDLAAAYALYYHARATNAPDIGVCVERLKAAQVRCGVEMLDDDMLDLAVLHVMRFIEGGITP
jgi:hypothetical protein